MNVSPKVIQESAVNIISEGTRFEGKVTFAQVTRVHGVLSGEVHAVKGSMLILAESSMTEGNIFADELMVDGYVKGDIQAKTRVVLSRTGRVIGNIQTPALAIEFGAYFEGSCAMEGQAAPSKSVQ